MTMLEEQVRRAMRETAAEISPLDVPPLRLPGGSGRGTTGPGRLTARPTGRALAGLADPARGRRGGGRRAGCHTHPHRRPGPARPPYPAGRATGQCPALLHRADQHRAQPGLAAAGGGPRHQHRPDRGHARRAPAGQRVHHGGCRLRRGPLRAGRTADGDQAPGHRGAPRGGPHVRRPGDPAPGQRRSPGADRPDPLLSAADQLIRPGLGAEPAACPGAAGRCGARRPGAHPGWPPARGGHPGRRAPARPGDPGGHAGHGGAARLDLAGRPAGRGKRGWHRLGAVLGGGRQDAGLWAVDRRPVRRPAAGHHRAGQQPGGQRRP